MIGLGKIFILFKMVQFVIWLFIVDKVLFVVDWKDFDYQMMCEYDCFEKGVVNLNMLTVVLKKQFEDLQLWIIIIMIQKLLNFIGVLVNKGYVIFDEYVVIVFDECYCLQFGDMYMLIIKVFK